MNGSRRAGGHTRADVGVHIVEAVRGPRSVIVLTPLYILSRYCQCQSHNKPLELKGTRSSFKQGAIKL